MLMWIAIEMNRTTKVGSIHQNSQQRQKTPYYIYLYMRIPIYGTCKYETYRRRNVTKHT